MTPTELPANRKDPHGSEPRLNPRELEAVLGRQFPQHDMSIFRIESVEPMRVRVRMRHHESNLRPGGTVSGPTLMMLADTSVYMAVLAMLGEEAYGLTANLNIHFLRPPKPRDVIADTRLLRLGARSAVGEVTMYSHDDDQAVAVATATYTLMSREAGRSA